MKSWDGIIVGAGIIGLSLAIELRKTGMSVLLAEKAEPGREASWAAGGMLADSPIEMPAALQPLAAASARMYPEFVHELAADSGFEIDLRDQGAILIPSLAHIRHPQLRTAALGEVELSEVEPALGRLTYDEELELKHSLRERDFDPSDVPFRPMLGPAYYLKERSVDPRHLTAAAVAAARHRGVDFSSGDQVLAVEIEGGKAAGVRTNKTRFSAGVVVNCAGAWASRITSLSIGAVGASPCSAEEDSSAVQPRIPTRPVKGQMLCVAMPEKNLIHHVIRTPDVYLIPRSDGRLLIGATQEEAGFDKRTVPATIQKMRQSAIDLVPKLADARILEAWAGLRPGTPDNLPILGATAIPGYYAATGHFRDGILLAPVTAQVMRRLITGKNPGFDLRPFAAARFSS